MFVETGKLGLNRALQALLRKSSTGLCSCKLSSYKFSIGADPAAEIGSRLIEFVRAPRLSVSLTHLCSPQYASLQNPRVK